MFFVSITLYPVCIVPQPLSILAIRSILNMAGCEPSFEQILLVVVFGFVVGSCGQNLGNYGSGKYALVIQVAFNFLGDFFLSF